MISSFKKKLNEFLRDHVFLTIFIGIISEEIEYMYKKKLCEFIFLIN